MASNGGFTGGSSYDCQIQEKVLLEGWEGIPRYIRGFLRTPVISPDFLQRSLDVMAASGLLHIGVGVLLSCMLRFRPMAEEPRWVRPITTRSPNLPPMYARRLPDKLKREIL